MGRAVSEETSVPASDPATFTRFAPIHPLGLSRRSGEEVCFVTEANLADRSLGCIAEAPKGGLAWMMERDGDSYGLPPTWPAPTP